MDEALGKSIRVFFQNHAIVKLGVKGRAKGTSVADIVQQLEVKACPHTTLLLLHYCNSEVILNKILIL